MQVKTKSQVQKQTKKTFDWGISSTTIDFMQPNELSRVRDGSATNDCGCGGGDIANRPQQHARRPGTANK